jgi:hypothetical protein
MVVEIVSPAAARFCEFNRGVTAHSSGFSEQAGTSGRLADGHAVVVPHPPSAYDCQISDGGVRE